MGAWGYYNSVFGAHAVKNCTVVFFCIEIFSSMEKQISMSHVRTDMTHSSTKSSPIEIYKSYLKKVYLRQKMPDYGKWPRLPKKKFINLAVISREQLSQREAKEKLKALTYGDVSKLRHKGNIEFADLATPDKHGELPKFVLVEGAPGVGKSTFAWKACRKWAKGKILQDYQLVILIRLRDESVRKATSLDDLIQYPCDLTIKKSVVEKICKTGGKGVLLLLEGYDELPSSLRSQSLFDSIIKGDQFYEGTIVVTSRPWASESFLLPHYETKRQVSQYVEILGFTKENIQEYIISLVSEEPSLMCDIKVYLELHPHIHSMMYIPLNCAIVLEVYKCNKQENSPIPTTMTELYSSLIRSLLLRYICDLQEYKVKCTGLRLDDFNKLPACIQSHFDKLAEIAYEGLQNDTQIIFTEREIPSGLDTLGLMQSSMELYVDCVQKSFNFLHLTIQEFLAAYHLSTLPQSEQLKLIQIKKSIISGAIHISRRLLVLFLAGLSPSVFKNVLSCKQSSQILEPTVVHMLFEAKFELIQNNHHFKCSMPKDSFSCYVLGNVITRSSCHWDVTLELHRENIHMFVIGINSCHKTNSVKLKLSFTMNVTENVPFFNVYIGDEIAELADAKIIIETLSITYAYSNFPPFHRICIPAAVEGSFIDKKSVADSKLRITFFDRLSVKGCELCIKSIILSNIMMTPTHTEKFRFYLQNSPCIKSLELYDCNFESDAHKQVIVLPEFNMQNLNSLKLFHFGHDDWTNVYKLLKESKSLIELHVASDHRILCNIADIMCQNSNVKKVVLNNEYTIKSSGSSTDFLSVSISKMIKNNTTIREIRIRPKSSRDCTCMIANSLCVNYTLEVLELSNLMERYDAVAFKSMLKENTTLKELHLSLSTHTDAQHFIEALNCYLAMNKTLVKLVIKCSHCPYIDIIDPRISISIVT